VVCTADRQERDAGEAVSMAREAVQERSRLATIEACLRAQSFEWLSDSEQIAIFVDNKARIEFGAYLKISLVLVDVVNELTTFAS
jgi:hypothetical protein